MLHGVRQFLGKPPQNRRRLVRGHVGSFHLHPILPPSVRIAPGLRHRPARRSLPCPFRQEPGGRLLHSAPTAGAAGSPAHPYEVRVAATLIHQPESATVATDLAFETRGLTKRYGSIIALDSVDLAAPRTSIGLLGANGAGKSTLIKLLLGLIRPDAGDARVLGRDIRTDAVPIRAQVGYMPEGDCLPADATAADFVAHMAEISGLPSRAARQRAADVLYQVGLEEERYRLIKGFSTGMKQRVKLAQAIVHDPQLVFLDEPTNGMDPQGRDEMLALIARIHRMLDISVVLSSHILDDVERVCRYVIILDAGRLVAAQSLEEPGQVGDALFVRIDGDPAVFAARLAALGVEAELGNPERGRDELTIPRADAAAYDAIRDAAADLGVPLRSLRARTRSLEDLYFGNVAHQRGPDGRVA
ncbi:MAG: ABC transporter ATP-binding protein [Thermomicrobiales bacterium]|nr:ABC transporter ATP-binding protein [Thermomicrobiales bacterium]